ncbi:MAG: trans-2-enoyl-CoA reductase family protein [Oscillospiraceae bacterium]|nr:trans-2-enoyl-CoA reductase family protein [Oscillospiraceae bacterium]
MLIEPRFRGYICTTAHPDGCFANVGSQIRRMKDAGAFEGPKRALVIGAGSGYGLASRVALAFGSGAGTVGVSFERPAAQDRTASAGWYNTACFAREANRAGLVARSLNGDAFSDEMKGRAIEAVKAELGQVDCVVYSIASPRRADPKTGEVYGSVIKPLGKPFTGMTLDFHTGALSEVTVEPATEGELRGTLKVMGGEDWAIWISALEKAGALASGCVTLAYTYVGPEVTHAIYKDGTIGKAKDDLEATALGMRSTYAALGLKPYVSVNKAVVTQSSSAIPVVPLYMTVLMDVMGSMGLEEDCAGQMRRLFAEELPKAEAAGGCRIRLDDREMRPDVQREVGRRWEALARMGDGAVVDAKAFRDGFFKLFGFGVEGVDYGRDTDPDVGIVGLVEP